MLRCKTETRPGLVTCTTSGQEMEQVNSYNPGARTGEVSRWLRKTEQSSRSDRLWTVVE